MATSPTAHPHSPQRRHADVQARLLDTAGRVDIPTGDGHTGPVHVTARQVPLPGGPEEPATVMSRLCDGELSVGDIIEAVVVATVAALERYDDVVIDDLFGVLAKVGIREEDVPLKLIERLADKAAARHARIQATTRWSCPSARTLKPFMDRGVPVMLSA
jgi:putative hydrolase